MQSFCILNKLFVIIIYYIHIIYNNKQFIYILYTGSTPAVLRRGERVFLLEFFCSIKP